jgi:hypothetical protein
MGKKDKEMAEETVPFESETDAEIARLEAIGLSNPLEAMPEEFADHKEENLKFAPFWKPVPIDMVERDYVRDYVRKGRGLWFYGMPVEFDNRDADFQRWRLIAGADLVCYRGSVAQGKEEKVIVRKDEPFTISVYASLPLENYIGIRIKVQVVDQVPTDRPKPRWVFQVTVGEADKHVLEAERKERARFAIERLREARNLNGGTFRKPKELPANSGR